MSVGASGNFGQIKKLNRKSQDIPGAVVIGGDYQGLGIVRSLGRRGIPIPETWFPDTLADLGQITTAFPLALKPGIKEHFFYATKAKAWRADTETQLRELFARASELPEPREILVQDLIPGDGKNQFAYCAFFKDGKA